MKVFRIPVWNDDSGLTHISTTWRLTSDKEGNDVIKEVINSKKYLNYWSVNVVVPKGKIYYIRAKREFKEVDDSVWIGPHKIINEDAGVSEMIKPELKIDTPFISDINLDYENGISVKLNPYSGTTPQQSTSWIIKDLKGKIIYKSLYDKDNLLNLKIANTDINFTDIPYISISVIFHGELGIESSPLIEMVELSKKYYRIDANKKIVPSELPYKGSIKQTTIRKVTLKKATLYDVTGKRITEAKLNDNDYEFSSLYLLPHMSYKVELVLIYDNDDSTAFNVSYTFYTKSISEKIVFDTNRKYKQIYSILQKNDVLVFDKANSDIEHNDLNKDIQMLSEETYVGAIPLMSVENNIKHYFNSSVNKKFGYIKDSNFNKEFKKYVKVELTPNNYLYVDTVTTKDDVDIKTLYIFKFNPYTLQLNLLNTIYRSNEYITDYNTNSYGVLNGEFYWCSIDKDSKTDIIIRKVNKDTLELETLYKDKLDDKLELDNVIFSRTILNKFVVIPQYYNHNEEFFGYVYDVSKNDTYKLFTIPKEVRNKKVIVNTLDNGNILLQRTRLEDGKLYYVIINVKDTDNIITKYSELMIDEDVELLNSVRLKSGNVLQYGYNENGTLVAWG